MALNCSLSAQLYTLLGDNDKAQDELNELLLLIDKNNSQLLTTMHAFGYAWMCLKEYGESMALDKVLLAFSLAENEGILAFPGFLHTVMAELALQMVKNQMHNHFVLKMINRWGLIPTSSFSHLEHWSWKVKIHTFDDFKVEIDNQTLGNGNSHRRSFDLLELLATLNQQRISKTKLSTLLWPDSDGDKAAYALENLLYRTRNLLGSELLLIQAGEIELNKTYCWVDNWALVNLDVANSDGELQCRDNAKQLMHIYKGALLPSNETEIALIKREKMRKVFCEKAISLGDKLVHYCDDELLTQFWLQAIDREPLQESFYFKLAQQYSESGYYSEAKQTYQSCQNLLQSSFNTPPSKQFQDFVAREYL